MKKRLFLLSLVAGTFLGAGCQSTQTVVAEPPSSTVTRTHEENTTRVVDSVPVIGQPVKSPGRP